ncbi:MAG: efflux RND transporter periplasmic adaptor subunit [Candidatus Omnitrophica bacterium]|nr:efflux RND transporter periplasmic adaptor subunit [Candidatus Omnitrophota bacterium]
MRNKLSAAVFILCILLNAPGCGQNDSASSKSVVPDTIPVKAVMVKPGNIQEYIDYVANVKAQEEAYIYPKVTGKIVEKVKQEGDQVIKGDVIAWIDRDEVGLTFEISGVESPISGVVGKVLVDVGANVSPQTAIALVVDMEKVNVNLDISEKYLPDISVGMPAEVIVEAYPREVFTGNIVRISPIVDTATRTSMLEISIDNKSHKLYSGMYAKVKVVTKEFKDALVVLKEAVLGKEPQQYVYVVRDQKAAIKDVKVGVRQGPYLQIAEGLAAGDKVVIMGQQRLYEGAPVLVEENGL